MNGDHKWFEFKPTKGDDGASDRGDFLVAGWGLGLILCVAGFAASVAFVVFALLA